MSSEHPTRCPRRRPGHVLAGAGGARVLAIALGACGVSAGSGSVVESAALPKVATASVVHRAAERTGEVRTATVRAEVVSTDDANDPVVRSVTEGAYDARAGRGRFTTSVDGDLTGLAGKDVSAEVVIDRGDVYVKATGIAALSGKEWIEVPAGSLGSLGTKLQATTALHPEAVVDALRGASSKVEELGTEPLDGTPTRHLRVHLDIEKALAKVPADRRERLQAALDRLGSGADRLRDQPADIWVDADGYVRRMKLTTSLEGIPGASALGNQITETIDLGGFGEPVDVQVPPADQVRKLDPSSLFGD
ncbi:MAG: hypothetical protein U0P45_15280 [Acidimicrobiales bacterium]